MGSRLSRRLGRLRSGPEGALSEKPATIPGLVIGAIRHLEGEAQGELQFPGSLSA